MQIFTLRTVCDHNLRVLAKFRRDRMNGCLVIANFRFPKWRPFAILDFQYMPIFTLGTVCDHKLRVLTKFRRDRLNGC